MNFLWNPEALLLLRPEPVEGAQALLAHSKLQSAYQNLPAIEEG
jgi:hypothetical protein